MSQTLELLLETAREAALAAGAFLREQSGRELVVNEAHHHDLKIQLDVDSQQLITRIILQAFPDHSILGEEGGEGSAGRGGYEWILDPIDGTVNLAYGIPHYCVSIAVRLDGEIVVGVVYDPNRNELFEAFRGGGAKLNGRSIRVSSRTEMGEAIVALGFSKNADSIEKCLELYAHYAHRVRKLRAMGSAALDMAYIAAGRLDAYIEQGVKIWDIAAGIILIEEAGGKVDLLPRSEPHHFHTCAWNGRIDFLQR